MKVLQEAQNTSPNLWARTWYLHCFGRPAARGNVLVSGKCDELQERNRRLKEIQLTYSLKE